MLFIRKRCQILFIGGLTKARVKRWEKMIKTYGLIHFASAVKGAKHAFGSYGQVFGVKKIYDCRRKSIQSRQSKISILSL